MVALHQSHKHLGLILDQQLNFNLHLKEKTAKANKGIGVIKKLYDYVPRSTLLTIYKMFVRPHLDYGDIIYDHPNNEHFKSKLESVQYNAALAITGAIRGTSRDKLFNELGIESLSDRRWFRRLTFFYNIISNALPSYLSTLLNRSSSSYPQRRSGYLHHFIARTDYFSFSFFPHSVREWNKLDPAIQSSKSLMIFKNKLLPFIWPSASSIFNIHNPYGLKLLTRLRLGLSHLCEHKFRHNFRDTINPLCPCNGEPETTDHYLLRCHLFSSHRNTLLVTLNKIVPNFTNLQAIDRTNICLYGSKSLSVSDNKNILEAIIAFILDS